MKSLPITAAVTTRMVAQFLALKGLEPISVTPPTQVTDGEIMFQNDIHVQVGLGYACVVSPTEDNCLRFDDNRYDAKDLVPDLKKALNI